jgi:hypothetical protein
MRCSAIPIDILSPSSFTIAGMINNQRLDVDLYVIDESSRKLKDIEARVYD